MPPAYLPYLPATRSNKGCFLIRPALNSNLGVDSQHDQQVGGHHLLIVSLFRLDQGLDKSIRLTGLVYAVRLRPIHQFDFRDGIPIADHQSAICRETARPDVSPITVTGYQNTS